MSYSHAFRGELHSRRFIPDDWPRYSRVLDHLEGKRVELIVGKEPRQRSDSQLAYYWAAVIRTVALETAGDEYDKDVEADIHDHLLREVLVPMMPERFLRASKRGRAIRSRPSTGVLSLEEMAEYVGRCKDYVLREWGIQIPEIEHVSLRRS